jgi:hypothetical protein
MRYKIIDREKFNSRLTVLIVFAVLIGFASMVNTIEQRFPESLSNYEESMKLR